LIKLIIFDLGGVVLDVPSDIYVRYLSKASGLSESSIRQIVTEYSLVLESGNWGLKQFEQNVGKALGIGPAKVMWLTFFQKHAKLNEDVVKIAIDLSKIYKIAFLSNNESARFNYAEKRIMDKIMHVFSYRFLSYRIGAVKPNKYIYDYAIKKTGLKPQEILFIDDMPVNVIGARAAGMKAVQFTNARQLKLDLKKFGVKIR